jgi:hypothetical protein
VAINNRGQVLFASLIGTTIVLRLLHLCDGDSTLSSRGCSSWAFDPASVTLASLATFGIAFRLAYLRSCGGEYRKRTLEVLADLGQRNRLPIFTVGTESYSVVHGR